VCKEAREKMGPISAVHYNCYDLGGGDPMADGSVSAMLDTVSVAITGLLTSAQECRSDLKMNSGIFLVTSSGIGATDIPAPFEEFVVSLNLTGYCVAKAAQQKLTSQLEYKLKPDGIFVGTVFVNGMVKGTKFDDGSGAARIEPDAVADAFWKLANDRTDSSTKVENPA
jgi:NAD(P)-dependent dehydrogenase (short-subunit alcohol dehydrogenase family)